MMMTLAVRTGGTRPTRWPVAALVLIVVATAMIVAWLAMDRRPPVAAAKERDLPASTPYCPMGGSVTVTPALGASLLHVANGSAARVQLALADGTMVQRPLVNGFTLVPAAGMAGDITLFDARGGRLGSVSAPRAAGTAS